MKFLLVLLQWFSKDKTDPPNTETKKAIIQLLLIDNFIVLMLAFWLGVLFAVNNPQAAEGFLNLFETIQSLFG